MKKKFSFKLILMLPIIGFASCTEKEYITINPEPEAPDTKTYTIML